MRQEYTFDAQHLDNRHKTRQTLYPGGDVVQKMNITISPSRFGARRNVIYTNSGLVPDSGYYSVTGFQTVNSEGTESSVSMTTPEEEARQWYWGNRCMWGNAAMTIKGMEDKDIYVIAHSTTMAQTGDISLYFLGVDRNESGSLSSHHITVNGGNQYFGAKAFDFNNRLCGVDVAAGDFDGDGQDEIVIFVLEDSGGTIYPRLEFWGFNRGSIAPVRAWGCNKGGAGDTSLLGYSIGGGEYNQSFKTAEDFCITAWPLSGVRGRLKLAEDIAISHVDEYARRVFVIPPVLNENRDFIAFGETKKVCEFSGVDSARRGGLITSDFANESLMLGSPVHTVDTYNESYVTVLQAFPYHVDNVDAAGHIHNAPINYTFSGFEENGKGNGYMEVSYTNTKSSSQKNDVSFGMSSTTETVSVLGEAGKYVAGYLKFRTTEANIAGNFDPRIKAAAGAMNAIMDLVTDKIDTTTTNASSNAQTTSTTDVSTAYQNDTFNMFTNSQHIWRYKILNDPLPSWYVLGPKADHVDGKLNAESKERYLTFSMVDDLRPVNSDSVSNSSYNARHEEGNLFSYPTSLTEIDGFTENELLVDEANIFAVDWMKSYRSKNMTFQQTRINSQKYDENIKKSELTKTVSAITAFLGVKNPSPLPPYTSHSESFVKTLSTSEAIDIKFQGRSSNPNEAAGNTMTLAPYLTREGALKAGAAVTLNLDGTQYLWSERSIYRRKPDPSLVLVRKFLRSGSNIAANKNNRSATLARGIRFYAPDLELDSNNKTTG